MADTIALPHRVSAVRRFNRYYTRVIGALSAARAIYQQAGFHLVASAPHRDFGPPMVGEDWELALR